MTIYDAICMAAVLLLAFTFGYFIGRMSKGD